VKSRLASLLLGVATAVAVVSAAASAGGAVRTPAVFEREQAHTGAGPLTFVDVSGGLCLMRSDGTHRLRFLRSKRRVNSPVWSPNGRYVAFARATGGDQSKIFVADAQGRVLWHFGEAHQDESPVWSPDGRRIVYTFKWAHAIGLAVARPNGSDRHEIAISPLAVPYGPGNPTWSADGRRLAFDDGGSFEVPQGIYSTSADGSDRRMLVSHAIQPAFSPDGSKLAYVVDAGIFPGGIVIADAEGQNARTVTSSPDANSPSWSPNGRRLAFRQGRAIVIADIDGSKMRALTARSLSGPVWSPDGKLIAFTRGPSGAAGDRPFTSMIVVTRSDGGSGERVVVRRFSKTWVQPPAWRPPTGVRTKDAPC
jgi:Tol biopolymer transport system component